MTIRFRSDFTVLLEDCLGDDATIANVARVSTGRTSLEQHKNRGLLNMLMRDRHGTPWEAGVLRFYIESPLFVNREFFRHRIASYNETSSRYRELEPVFYVPGLTRPLVQTGKPGAYTFEHGGSELAILTRAAHASMATAAWNEYQHLLERGVAREVARNVLPLNIYSSFYVTMNLRALFNFLSLRRVTDDTSVPTFPLWEIDKVAAHMEEKAEDAFPVAFEMFRRHGRVAP